MKPSKVTCDATADLFADSTTIGVRLLCLRGHSIVEQVNGRERLLHLSRCHINARMEVSASMYVCVCYPADRLCVGSEKEKAGRQVSGCFGCG